jgi:(p)ppGpp synthase/HD superfamily hydrolase
MLSCTTVSLIQSAIELAARAHQRQRRKRSGLPYITHCIVVRDLVATNGGGEVAQAAAMLHDVIEDTNVSIDGFPQSVKTLVDELTVRPGEAKIDAIKRIKSKDALLIKLCDRYHNLSDTCRFLDYKFGEEWMDTTRHLLRTAREKGLSHTKIFKDLERAVKEIKAS